MRKTSISSVEPQGARARVRACVPEEERCDWPADRKLCFRLEMCHEGKKR